MSFPEGDAQARDDARKTADAVARRSYGKLVAFLAAMALVLVLLVMGLIPAFSFRGEMTPTMFQFFAVRFPKKPQVERWYFSLYLRCHWFQF